MSVQRTQRTTEGRSPAVTKGPLPAPKVMFEEQPAASNRPQPSQLQLRISGRSSPCTRIHRSSAGVIAVTSGVGRPRSSTCRPSTTDGPVQPFGLRSTIHRPRRPFVVPADDGEVGDGVEGGQAFRSGRTTSTGHWACWTSAWLVEPRSIPVKPPRP